MSDKSFSSIISGIISAAVLIVLIGIGVTTCISKNQDDKIQVLEKNITELKEEYIPVRFVKTTKKNKIYVNVSFYNKEDKKIGTKKITFQHGNEIFFDFKTVTINSNVTIFFPYMIFTDMIAPENGEKLYDEYSKSTDQQKLYNFEDKEVLNLVNEYFRKIINNEAFDTDTVKGSGVHDLAGIRSFVDGKTYEIVCHNKTGGIEIVEEK